MITIEKLVLPLLFYNERTVKENGRKVRKSGFATPTWNHIYVRRNVLSTYAKAYKHRITEDIAKWKERTGWQTVDRKLIVNIWVFFPDHRVRDCHNLDKLLLDAMEDAGIFTNDRFALVRYIDYDVDPDAPRFEVAFEVKP